MKRIKVHKKIFALAMTFLLTLGLVFPSNGIVYASNENIGENEAVSYVIEKTVSEDISSVEIVLTMKKKEGINTQKVVLPDGTEQEYSDTIKVNVTENGKLNFKVKYEDVNAESGEIDIPVEVTEIVLNVGNESANKTIDENNQNNEQTISVEKQAKKEETVSTVNVVNTMAVLDISKGNIEITVSGITVNGIAVQDYDPSLPYVITGTGGTNTISISGITKEIILRDTSISTTNANPVWISGNANVTFLLEGTNSLISAGTNFAALRVDNDSSITINSNAGTGSTNGKLIAHNTSVASFNASGIGGNKSAAGNITILGGTIDALGSVGIGGTLASDITISGGDVTAQGTINGAGIGGYSGNCGTIQIDGGTVHATGGRAGAGIGNGASGNGGTITITGNAKVTAIGGYEGAGIGLGQSGKNIDISISENPTIEVQGDRADIGGGGQENMTGTINISGGTIHTTGLNTAIGVDKAASGVGCIVNISNAKISGTNNEASVIRADIIDVKDTSISYEHAAKSSISGLGDVTLSNSIIKTLGGFYSSKGTLIFDNANITVGSDDSYSSITTATKDIIIRNNSNMSLKSKSSTVVSSNANIIVENSKLNAEFINTTASSTDWTYGLKATENLTFNNSDIEANFTQEKDRNLLSYAFGIDVKNSTIKSNGRILGKSGDVNIESGYLQLTKASPSIASSGNVTISGGYIDSYGSIGTTGTQKLTINAVDGQGDGNAIVFAKGYSYGGSQDISKGIVFYNENNTSSLKLKGLVLGDVTLKHLIEDNGKQFTIPAEYELHIQDSYNASLTIPVGMKLINDGVIMNEKTVTVNGEFLNSKDALIYNLNLTPDKGTAYGGEFTGTGTLTNLGDVRNEIYVSEIKLDNKAWNKTDASLSTITNMKELSAEVGENRVFAHQGDTALYYSDIKGRDLKSEWKYINTDLEYFTLTYDLNYTGATTLPSEIVAKGLIKEPEQPKRNGYVFDGWYLEKGKAADIVLGKQWDFENNSLETTTTLYAKWNTPDINKVDFVDWDGTVLKSEDVVKGQDATAPIDPTRDGYTFTGWDKTFTNIQTGLTITATYTINKYEVNFESNGGTEVPAITDVEYNNKIPAPNEPNKAGHTFAGWYTDKDLKNPWNFVTDKVVSDMTLYASWKKADPVVDIYNVTFEFNGGTFRGEVNPEFEVSIFSDSSRLITVYPYDTFVTKEGYTFTGWYSDKECTKKWDFKKDKVNGNMKLYAGWEKSEKPAEPVNPSQPNKPSTDNPSVNTGDTTNTMAYSIGLMVSMLALFAIATKKNKKGKVKK